MPENAVTAVKMTVKMFRPGATEPDFITVEGTSWSAVYNEVEAMVAKLTGAGWKWSYAGPTAMGYTAKPPAPRAPLPGQKTPAQRPNPVPVATKKTLHVDPVNRITVSPRSDNLLRVDVYGLLPNGTPMKYPMAATYQEWESVRALLEPVLDLNDYALPIDVAVSCNVMWVESDKTNKNNVPYKDIVGITTDN